MMLSAASTMGFAYIPDDVHTIWINLTISLARGIGFLCGLETATHGDILSVNGFDMQIITQCTAIHYLLIISAAMLASHWHSTAYRITGIGLAVPVLLVANAIRLLVTGLAGAVSMELFNFVHEYLWVTLFILLTWGIWAAWERGVNTGSLKKRAPLLLLFCTISHLILTLLNRSIATLITGIANILVSPFDPLNQLRFSQNEGLVVSAVGIETYTLSLNGEILILAAFTGLIFTRIVLKENIPVLRSAVYWILFLFLSALIVTCNGIIIKLWGTDIARIFLWLSPAVMTTLLMILWGGLKDRSAYIHEKSHI